MKKYLKQAFTALALSTVFAVVFAPIAAFSASGSAGLYGSGSLGTPVAMSQSTGTVITTAVVNVAGCTNGVLAVFHLKSTNSTSNKQVYAEFTTGASNTAANLFQRSSGLGTIGGVMVTVARAVTVPTGWPYARLRIDPSGSTTYANGITGTYQLWCNYDK